MLTLLNCAWGASTNMLSLGQQSVNFRYVHCLLLSYFSFCNIYILEIPVTYFREQCATLVSAMLYKFGHALFQADSGVWGVFLPLRFSPHSWLFLVCYANSSKFVLIFCNIALNYYWHISIICRYWYASIVYLGSYHWYLKLVCLGRILMLVCLRRSFPSELTFGWQRLVIGVKPIAVQPYKADLCHGSGKQRCPEVQHIPLSLSLSLV